MIATIEMTPVLMWMAVGSGVLTCLVGLLIYNFVVSLLEQRQRDREFERSMELFQAEAEAQHESAMSYVFHEGEDDGGFLFKRRG